MGPGALSTLLTSRSHFPLVPRDIAWSILAMFTGVLDCTAKAITHRIAKLKQMAAADGANGSGESHVSSPVKGGTTNGNGRKKAAAKGAKGAKRTNGNGKSIDDTTTGEVDDEIGEPVKLEDYMGSNAIIKVDNDDNGDVHYDHADDVQGNGEVVKEKETRPRKKRKRNDRKQRTSETERDEGSTLLSISSGPPY